MEQQYMTAFITSFEVVFSQKAHLPIGLDTYLMESFTADSSTPSSVQQMTSGSRKDLQENVINDIWKRLKQNIVAYDLKHKDQIRQLCNRHKNPIEEQ